METGAPALFLAVHLDRSGRRAEPLGCADRDDGRPRLYVAVERSCLLPDGLLDGQIDFLTNQRLSDHLRVARGYLVVREAAWRASAPDSTAPADPIPVILVNIARLVGIAEATAQRGHGHPGRYHTTAADYEVG